MIKINKDSTRDVAKQVHPTIPHTKFKFFYLYKSWDKIGWEAINQKDNWKINYPGKD